MCVDLSENWVKSLSMRRYFSSSEEKVVIVFNESITSELWL